MRFILLFLVAVLPIQQLWKPRENLISFVVQTPDICNFARIRSPKSLKYVIVRSGPGGRFREVDRIFSGVGVYICNERGDWFKISYDGPHGRCDTSSVNGLDARKAASCQSGWVRRKFVEVISG